MANTIWVRANRTDRKVILSEYDELHPTDTHEIWIVGYEDPRFDADGNQIEANPPIEVGDTAGVRQAIADKDLVLVDGPGAGLRGASRPAEQPSAAERETQAGNRATEKSK
jgi:hypothetical protein